MLSPITLKKNLSLSRITPDAILKFMTVASPSRTLMAKNSSSEPAGRAIFCSARRLPSLASVSLISLALSNCLMLAATAISSFSLSANALAWFLSCRTSFRSRTCPAYFSWAHSNSQGPSQLPRWYSRQTRLGSVLHMRTLKVLRRVPMVSSLELPWTKGPYTSPLPMNRPSLVRRATTSLGYSSSVTLR